MVNRSRNGGEPEPITGRHWRSIFTPTAFENFSPALFQPWDQAEQSKFRPKVLAGSGFRNLPTLSELSSLSPQRSQGCGNPGLKLTNAAGVISTLLQKNSLRGVFALLVFVFVIGQPMSRAQFKVAAQVTSKPSSKQQETKSTQKSPFVLVVKDQPILNISLKADKAKLSDLAGALSKKLKTAILVSPAMEKELVTVQFSELTLEPAMQLMAPQVYVDYEIHSGDGSQPKPIGIYFYAANQAEPPMASAVGVNNQSLLVEGNTEDGLKSEKKDDQKQSEEPPLKVSFQNNFLSVKARKQPIALVLLKIGEAMGIPVEVQSQVDQLVDKDIAKAPADDAILRLSPNITLYLRADLTHAEKRALKIVLREPKSFVTKPGELNCFG